MVFALVICTLVLFFLSISLTQSVYLDAKQYMPVAYQKNYEYVRVLHQFIYEDYVPFPLQKRYCLATTLGAVTFLCPFVASLAYRWTPGILLFLLPTLAAIWTVWHNVRHFKRRGRPNGNTPTARRD